MRESSDLTGLRSMDSCGLVPGRKSRVSADPGLPMPSNANAILGAGLSGNPRLIWPVTSPYGNCSSIWLGFSNGGLENRSNSGMTSGTSASINTEGMAFSSTVKESEPLRPPALQMLPLLSFEGGCWDGQVYLLLGRGSQGKVWSRTSQLLCWVVPPHLPFPCFSSSTVLITGRDHVNEALEK